VKAMGLTGQLLMGQAVMVKSAEVPSPPPGSLHTINHSPCPPLLRC